MDYVKIIQGASGITEVQAKTCYYYSLGTYLLLDKVDLCPLLLILGGFSTGKTALCEQMAELVKEPKSIGGETRATLRDELASSLDGKVTAIIDEADGINERYLQKRYQRSTSNIMVKIPDGLGGWTMNPGNIFGATILGKRRPFHDGATISRTITIKTQPKFGDYSVTTEIDRSELEAIALSSPLDLKTSDRPHDTWRNLLMMAAVVGDKEWINYAEGQIKLDLKAVERLQTWEPEQSILMVLRAKMMPGGQGVSVKLSAISEAIRRESEVRLKLTQIEQIVIDRLGFRVTNVGGYRWVKPNLELLKKRLKEYKLDDKLDIKS